MTPFTRVPATAGTCHYAYNRRRVCLFNSSISTPDDIAVVERLAREIWSQHFTPIIGVSQVDYMLGKFQSVDAILSHINSGWKYYLALLDNEAVGYAGLVPDISNNTKGVGGINNTKGVGGIKFCSVAKKVSGTGNGFIF